VDFFGAFFYYTFRLLERVSAVDKKIHPQYESISIIHRYGVRLAGWGFMLYACTDAFDIGNFQLYHFGLWLMIAMLLCVLAIALLEKNALKNVMLSLGGLVYISISFAAMMNLRAEGIVFFGSDVNFDLGWVIPVILIASIWINDTMAYIVGSLIGKTPFSKISPHKTWEGTLGGALLAIAVITLLGYFVFEIDDYISLIVIAAIAAIAGTTGDIFESKLKRMAQVKDSGNILPGHGGFLDRFDSLIAATPFVWLYTKLFL